MAHAGSRITFGCSDLTVLAQSLVEIGLATGSDWIGAGKTPAALVDSVFRRFLRDHGQEIIAEHFELSLTLGESIVDTTYSDSGVDSNGQLFLVLNTESSFPLGLGTVIDELERCHPGIGVAFYDTLRQALYRWIRVYDHWDARNRIEQMVEWAEGEEDPDSYEIPKLNQDLPECLRTRIPAESPQSLDSFPAPTEPLLKGMVETTLELHRISYSMDRPPLDEEWLENQRSYHSLDLPLPAILLYFRPGDAVMACFDDECERRGPEISFEEMMPKGVSQDARLRCDLSKRRFLDREADELPDYFRIAGYTTGIALEASNRPKIEWLLPTMRCQTSSVPCAVCAPTVSGTRHG